MKKINYLFLPIIFLTSCFTPYAVRPKYEPISSNYVTVRMQEGRLNPEIRNSRFYISTDYLPESPNGALEFIIVIFNYTDNFMPIRYTDFKLYYTNKNGNNVIERCLTPDEYIKYGNTNSYRKETLERMVREWPYLRENDIRPVAYHPDGNRISGFIAFPFDDFENFKLSITIFGEEYFIEFK